MTDDSPIRDRKIRFALTGCGRIAGNHFSALEKHSERAELVAVCDSDPVALEKAVARTGAKGYRSHQSMVEDCPADIVAIATPSGLHSAQAIAVAKAGRHVMTEKPMATRWRDGLEMVRACDQAG